MDNLLNSGLYFLAEKFIVLPPRMEFKKQVTSSLPMWVIFLNLPFDMWKNDKLSFVSSCIRIPLHMDKQCFVYARVCADIKVGYKVPKRFKLKLGYGTPIEITIEIPWKPPSCTHCISFGHTSSTCPPSPYFSIEVPS